MNLNYQKEGISLHHESKSMLADIDEFLRKKEEKKKKERKEKKKRKD